MIRRTLLSSGFDRVGQIFGAVVVASAIASFATADPGTLTGNARAIDGDTLILGSVLVRLAEIDAPERDQTCTNAIGGIWYCGHVATTAIRTMLAADPLVACTVRDRDRYGRTVAVCRNTDGDLAGRLVALGLAVVWPRYSTGIYDDRQAAAVVERAGMWSGTFEWPWEWRQKFGTP